MKKITQFLLIITVAAVLIATAIGLANSILNARNEAKELDSLKKEKLKLEVELLRMKVNPTH